MTEENRQEQRKGPGPGESPPGCGGGCLGCLGTVAVVLVLAVMLFAERRNAKWNGYSQAMDELVPGMTEEEVRAMFPENSMFETENTDDFGCRTWVTDSEAAPRRVLRVGPREEDTSTGGDFGAEVYFDESGKLVGVRNAAAKKGGWTALWGISSGVERSGGDEQE